MFCLAWLSCVCFRRDSQREELDWDRAVTKRYGDEHQLLTTSYPVGIGDIFRLPTQGTVERPF